MARTSLPRSLPVHIYREMISTIPVCHSHQASADRAPVCLPRTSAFFYFPAPLPAFYNSCKSAAGSVGFHLREILLPLYLIHLQNLFERKFLHLSPIQMKLP